MVSNCNQTNTKQIVENVKNFDQKLNVKNFEEQRVKKNFKKSDVLKEKLSNQSSEIKIIEKNDDVTFEFRNERLLQGRDPKTLKKLKKQKSAVSAVLKMFKKNLSLVDKSINIERNIKSKSNNELIYHTPKSSEQSNILVTLPLTGPYSNFGNEIREALDLSILHVGTDDMKQIYYDTGKELDINRLKNIIDITEPRIIVGPFTRESLLKIKPLAKEKFIPMITFSNDIAIIEGDIWTLGFSPEEQMQRIIFCALKNNFQRFGIIVPNNLYGKIINQASIDAISLGGQNIYETLLLTNNQLNDKKKLFLKLQKFLDFDEDINTHNKFDAIILAGSKEFILEIAPLLAFLNVDSKVVKILGTEIFNTVDIRNEPSLEKSWFPLIQNKNENYFKVILKKTWNKNASYFSRAGFDAGVLAINYLKSSKKEKTFFENAQTPVLGFIFKQNGEVQKPINIMQINNLGNLSVVEKCINLRK